MEAAIVGVIGRIAPLLIGFLEKEHKLQAGLEEDINFIKIEFELICLTIEKDGDEPLRCDNKSHKKWIDTLREIGRSIEDCIDNFTHRTTLQSSASLATRTHHKIIKFSPRRGFANKIKRLKKRCVGAREQRDRYTTDLAKEIKDHMKKPSNFEPGWSEAYANYPVGMKEPYDELMELISETPQGQPKQLKVISIVGFGGIGKSHLAKDAYHTIDHDESEYPTRAWISAAGKDVKYALNEILRQLDGSECTRSTSGGSQRISYHLSGGRSDGSPIDLCARLNKCLGKNRFFVVIDDMQIEFWDYLKDAFPVVCGVSSRVIVTTATQSIAAKCSSHDGHVYVMRTLDEEHSRQLFFSKACLVYAPQLGDVEIGLLIKKCDGLPLALVTTARLLHGDPTRGQWADLGENLGSHLETHHTLASLRHVLVRSYTSLGSAEIKTCLLYLGIYPRGSPIRKGILIRKWLAEGFIKQDPNSNRSIPETAVRNFHELVDQSIIYVSSSNNTEVKTCQTHGMMLEFILHKSMCENFVTLLQDKDPPPKSNIRWLSVHHKSNAMAKLDPNDLCLVRSLAIFSKAHRSMLDFPKYKLMKVLDLEECRDRMGDSQLKDICSTLVLLRYLSLGPAVKVKSLPEEIKMLKLLETLDVRRSSIEILPVQVMELPCLVHLFGKLKLRGIGSHGMSELKTWLSENSKLETLAGFVVDKSQQMPQLIEHMKHLTKVKIWCESTPGESRNINHVKKDTNSVINDVKKSTSSVRNHVRKATSSDINHVRKDTNSDITHLKHAIKGFVERSTNVNRAHSLSLNINEEWHQDLVYLKLKTDKLHYLRSLKLQGNNICSRLPWFVTDRFFVTKLCLSFPHHTLSSGFLETVASVRGVESLKLIAAQLENFVISQGALESLRILCIVVQVMTGLVTEERALPRLNSLKLLCKDLNGFSSTRIQSLPLLKEVALHNGLSKQTKQDWIQAAKNHPKRPKLLFEQERIYAAAATTDTVSQEINVEAEPTVDCTGETVPVLTCVIDSGHAANIPKEPSTTGNGTPIIQPEEYHVPVVTSTMESEPAVILEAVATVGTLAPIQLKSHVTVVTSTMETESATNISETPVTFGNVIRPIHEQNSGQTNGGGNELYEIRDTENCFNTSKESHIDGKGQQIEVDRQESRAIDLVRQDIAEVMDMIHKDGAEYDSTEYLYASQLFMEKKYRDVFNCFKKATAKVRLEWVNKTWELKTKQ